MWKIQKIVNFGEKLILDPEEKNDDYEIVDIYDDPKCDTIIYYDEDENQYVKVRDE